jgi:hypothetical protein
MNPTHRFLTTGTELLLHATQLWRAAQALAARGEDDETAAHQLLEVVAQVRGWSEYVAEQVRTREAKARRPER